MPIGPQCRGPPATSVGLQRHVLIAKLEATFRAGQQAYSRGTSRPGAEGGAGREALACGDDCGRRGGRELWRRLRAAARALRSGRPGVRPLHGGPHVHRHGLHVLRPPRATGAIPSKAPNTLINPNTLSPPSFCCISSPWKPNWETPATNLTMSSRKPVLNRNNPPPFAV
jgi:hypothetical protein